LSRSGGYVIALTYKDRTSFRPTPTTMSLIHAPKKGIPDAKFEASLAGSSTHEPDFVIIQEVSDLPPPSQRLGVDPRLETTVKMIEAIEAKQKELLPELNKIPKQLEKEADNCNKQINYLAGVLEASKNYLWIIGGTVGILSVVAGLQAVNMGVGFWKWLKRSSTREENRQRGMAHHNQEESSVGHIKENGKLWIISRVVDC